MADPAARPLELRPSRVDRREVGRISEEPQAWRGLPLAVALCAIVALAAALRVWDLNQLGFNSDEAVYSGQAAAIAGDEPLSGIFPIFRAHPLVVQFLISLVYSAFGVIDWAARLVIVAFGLGTVLVTYALGSVAYGRRAGVIAAVFVAVMPYHVIVTRQALLDGPMAFFATLTLLVLAKYAITERREWLYASGATLGLTFLAKETSIVLLPAIWVFLALTPRLAVRIRDVLISLAVFAAVVAPFPISLALGGGSGTAKNFLVWQIFRPPNHDWNFYLLTALPAMGLGVILLAAAGIRLLRRDHSWRETLLVTWCAVPLLFFQSWPVKGFQYLIAAAPAAAVLAARFLVARWEGIPLLERVRGAPYRMGAAGLIVVSLLIPSVAALRPNTSGTFLAGSGGVPGGREAGRWVRDHVPEGATLLTIGPSMANILQFYGHRRAFGLSVSPNPLHRNPVYDSVRNPDLELRTGDIQYVVWDAYSAARSSYFSTRILRYARRYHGVVVHSESIEIRTPSGATTTDPVIVIYQVTPLVYRTAP